MKALDFNAIAYADVAFEVASRLTSKDGENPEYDRAILELLQDLYGGSREEIASILSIKKKQNKSPMIVGELRDILENVPSSCPVVVCLDNPAEDEDNNGVAVLGASWDRNTPLDAGEIGILYIKVETPHWYEVQSSSGNKQ